MDKLTASEALYGFGAWLTCRDEQVTFSSKDDAGKMADLIDIFCKTNELEDPRDNWTDNLTHPNK